MPVRSSTLSRLSAALLRIRAPGNSEHLESTSDSLVFPFPVSPPWSIELDTERLNFPRVPSYWFFDQSRIDAGALMFMEAGPSGPQQLYKWSKDNSKEIEKGWITKTETIRALAARLSIDPETLEATVASYNSCCERGQDPVFGRESSLIALSSPPFYAVTLWPGGPNTQGGPKRNSKAQVLDVSGNPIPGLYAAGELGSIFGKIYPGSGGNLSECIAFGRIAGQNAAAETRRS